MEFSSIFPVWEQLAPSQRLLLQKNSVYKSVPKGTLIHGGSAQCTGLLLVARGQLRSYILSEEGRQITLYRLFDRDMCLFSASCIMNSIQFDLFVEAEKDAGFWIVSAEAYKSLMQESVLLANYTNELMATRFTEVMWLIDQILWKSLDKRLASFLLEESTIEGSDTLKTTHEIIANHLGSHREVITRMLRYFQQEGLVELARGTVKILDEEKLSRLRV